MDSIPRYLQLYFYDGQHEKENRLGLFPNLTEETITLLMGLMDDNPYGKFFRSLKEVEVTENTRIVLSTDPSQDQRVYNTPTSDEVAAVWADTTAMQGNEGPQIIAYGRGAHNHSIKHFYGCYDPLQYPLLLPKGDSGWHQGLNKLSSPTFDRETNSTFPIATLVDEGPESLVQAKIANAIRADLYQGIIDTLELEENSACNVGKRIVLPPSFLGGPRDMRKKYLNAMALVQKYGKPDLFITMTCNPNWPEIKAELSAGEQAQNRPDLLARVFHAKLTLLRKQIKEKKIIGEVAAMINVVEFQKRGLPHAHFLTILLLAYKITTPEKFDQYVAAEILSHDNPHLRAVVLRHMIHGPRVQPLLVHIPNGQMVRFRENEALEAAASDDARVKTMLTEYFTTNAAIIKGPKYLYSEFPEHFVWNEKLKKWKGRDRGVVIGRVAHASSGEGERYYLRLLLAHVRGPTSFDELLTVNGVCCVSFQEAALKRGILEQDNAAEQCMDEAVQVEMPNALRRLFATILIFSCPENPAEFWEQYYIPLSDDFRK
ncbi:uncharacterized protein LOC141594965 [Silene latifolia]|uniref:uncharacterized protein LOC141594965 n=1 Tax=Silene latifolia TaxID=37657 RepID=UPI003D782476